MSEPAPASPRASLFRRTGRFALVMVCALVPLLAAAVVQGLRDPAWWRPVPRGDAQAADRAAAFEQAIVGEFTRVRADAPEWSVRIREQDVNDWLGTRLPAWLESRGEPVGGMVQARFNAEGLRVGVALPRGVAWIRVQPRAHGGGVHLGDPAGGIGRLRVPFAASTVDLARFREALLKPISLADGRVVQVLDIEPLEGELRLRLRTEAAGSAR